MGYLLTITFMVASTLMQAQTSQDAAAVDLQDVFPAISRLRTQYGIPHRAVVSIDDFVNVSSDCLTALRAVAAGLSSNETWPAKMVDASSKVWSGIMQGNVVELGNFDECVAVRPTNVASQFRGKHCLATINMGQKKKTYSTSSWTGLEHSLKAAIKNEETAHRPRLRIDMDTFTAMPSLRMSFCIPSLCSAQDLQEGLNTVLSLTSLTSIQMTVKEADCHTDEGPSLRTKDWVAISVLLLFCIFLFSSTTYDLVTLNKDSRSPLLLAFSVYSNGKRLLSTSSGGRDNLPALHGIRFFSLAWVVMGHRYLSSLSFPSMNTTYILKFATDWKRSYILNATVSVDTFFLLSGLLVGYVFLNHTSKRGSRFNIFHYYLHRYIRLTPALAMVIMLQATLLRYTGSGPLWPSSKGVEDSCNKYWWSALLYVQNYVNPNSNCIGQTWYLSVDMQLFWLSPIVLIPLWKRPKLGLILLPVLMLVGLTTTFTIAYINTYLPQPLGAVHGMDPGNMAFQNVYIATHTRFAPWLTGVALGYLLYSLRGKIVLLPKWAVALGWALAALCCLGSLFGVRRYLSKDFVYNRIGDSLYDATFRSIWALGVAWVIFACVKGYGGPVNTLLSWNAWQPLSRLSYTMYLIHMQYQQLIIATGRVPITLGDQYEIPWFFADIVVSAGFATCLTLACESPAIILEKVLLQRGVREESKTLEEPFAKDGE